MLKVGSLLSTTVSAVNLGLNVDSAFRDIELTCVITGEKVMARFRITPSSQYDGCDTGDKFQRAGINFTTAGAISMGYQLMMVGPAHMGSSDHLGAVRYCVGNEQQSDLGQSADSERVINVAASVYQHRKVSHLVNGGRAERKLPELWPQPLERDSTFLLSGAGQLGRPQKCEYDNIHNCVPHNTANSHDITVVTYLAISGAPYVDSQQALSLLTTRLGTPYRF